ncbi:hypothetical protein [Bosea sp. (in: a-proteobacteria)]|uniref:hypothetical protein n=1 Tax=Bosea sp. (in: a-proteobacteria) TaxID=1871050 RepID=UPI002622744B|nr:hypothetical protein [Bosea sp. (in: a-proteobacteria)]MCO5092721.1 hypothetical protein [Bosea sp. (in: a-proteobacteria)]
MSDPDDGAILTRMKLLLALGIAASCGLAIWLALDGNAVIALPLVIVVGALVRALVRIVRGKHFRPAETPIAQDPKD